MSYWQRWKRISPFDLEEAGLIGSFDYTDNGILPTETILGVLNMEMIGYYSDEVNSQTFPTGFGIFYPEVQAEMVADQFRGNFITNIGDENSISLLEAFNESAAEYVPELKVISLVAPATWQSIMPDFGRSDHAPFWLKEIPALMLTDGSNFRNPYYHTANDLVSTLNFEFMTNVVKAIVATVAEEAGINHSTAARTVFSVTTSIENSWDCEIQVSPNPVKDQVQLLINNCDFDRINIQLFNYRGRLVYEKLLKENQSQNTTLDLRNLERGIYILQLKEGDKKLIRKIVVN